MFNSVNGNSSKPTSQLALQQTATTKKVATPSLGDLSLTNNAASVSMLDWKPSDQSHVDIELCGKTKSGSSSRRPAVDKTKCFSCQKSFSKTSFKFKFLHEDGYEIYVCFMCKQLNKAMARMERLENAMNSMGEM